MSHYNHADSSKIMESMAFLVVQTQRLMADIKDPSIDSRKQELIYYLMELMVDCIQHARDRTLEAVVQEINIAQNNYNALYGAE